MKRLSLAAALLASMILPAFAHLDPVAHDSFMAGLTHPLSGVDHILAMVTVGLWAAMIGGRALWLVPSSFVAAMGVGYVAALAGVALPFVEPTVLASVVVLGLLVALALPVPAAMAGLVVAFFAVFHGHAHGAEIGAAGAARYGLGFGLATALLHGVGLAAGLALTRALDPVLARRTGRIVGGLAAAGGLALVFAS